MKKSHKLLVLPVAIIFGAIGYFAYSKITSKKPEISQSNKQEPALLSNEVANTISNQSQTSDVIPNVELSKDKAFMMAWNLKSPSMKTQIDGIEFEAQNLVDMGNNKKALISVGGAVDPYPINPGYLKIHYFEVKNGAYQLVKTPDFTIESGSMGQIADIGLNDEITSNIVIFIEGSSSSQGITCSTTDLVELAPEGPRTIYSDLTFMSDERGETKGLIGNIKKDTSFDVTYKGTNAGIKHYVKNGKTYSTNSKLKLQC